MIKHFQVVTDIYSVIHPRRLPKNQYFPWKVMAIVSFLACVVATLTQPAQASAVVDVIVYWQDGVVGTTGGAQQIGENSTSISREVGIAGVTPRSGENYSAHAFASADLSSGQLKILAEALGPSGAQATATFGDRVYLSGPLNACGDGSVSDPFRVTKWVLPRRYPAVSPVPVAHPPHN